MNFILIYIWLLRSYGNSYIQHIKFCTIIVEKGYNYTNCISMINSIKKKIYVGCTRNKPQFFVGFVLLNH